MRDCLTIITVPTLVINFHLKPHIPASCNSMRGFELKLHQLEVISEGTVEVRERRFPVYIVWRNIQVMAPQC